jgi:hypothetical protein
LGAYVRHLVFAFVRRLGDGLASFALLGFFFDSAVFDEGLGEFVLVRQVCDRRFVFYPPLEVGVFTVDDHDEGFRVHTVDVTFTFRTNPKGKKKTKTTLVNG